MSEVSNWFEANKLSVSAGKTNYDYGYSYKMTSLEISDDPSLESNFDIILNSTKLKSNQNYSLGIIIDENLTWKDHIDGISIGYLG